MCGHDFKAAQIKRLVLLARQILAGEVNTIEAVRKICGVRAAIGSPDDAVFMPFRAIDSETDHFPIGSARTAWGVGPLMELDHELEQYLSEERDEIVDACNRLIDKYDVK